MAVLRSPAPAARSASELHASPKTSHPSEGRAAGGEGGPEWALGFEPSPGAEARDMAEQHGPSEGHDETNALAARLSHARHFLPVFLAGCYVWMVSTAPIFFSYAASPPARGAALGSLLSLIVATFSSPTVALAFGIYAFAALSATAQLIGDLPPSSSAARLFGMLGWFTYALAWGALSARKGASVARIDVAVREDTSRYAGGDAFPERLEPRATTPFIVPFSLALGVLGGFALLLPLGLDDRPRVLALAQILGLLGALALVRALSNWGNDLHFSAGEPNSVRLRRAAAALAVLVFGVGGALWWSWYAG